VVRRWVYGSIYDTSGNRIAEYEIDALAGTSTLLREYVWAGDRILAVIEDGAIHHVRTDHIGRPVFATVGDARRSHDINRLLLQRDQVLTNLP
jgi:hypothetical protein